MKPCGDCHEDSIEKAVDRRLLMNAKAACLSISGMGCNNCVARVRNSLVSLDGVLLAHIALDDALAVVAYQPKKVQPVDLVRAVASASHDSLHHYWANILTIAPASEVLPM